MEICQKVDASRIIRRMEISLNQTWYDAIVNNDLESAQTVLESHRGDPEEIDTLLNGGFTDDIKDDLPKTTMKYIWSCNKGEHLANMEINQPWHLAAVFGSTDVLKYLYDEGVNVQQVNESGANIINCLISVCVKEPTLENKMIQVFNFLVNLLKTEEMKDLLLHEHKFNYNCLEEATFLGTFDFANTILHTPGFMIHRSQDTVHEDIWLDVTKYESTKAGWCDIISSPLYLMKFISLENAESEKAKQYILQPIIQQYVEAKLYVVKPVLIMWMLFQFTLLTIHMFTSVFSDFGQKAISSSVTKPCGFVMDMSSSTAGLILTWISLILYSLLIIMIFVRLVISLVNATYSTKTMLQFRNPFKGRYASHEMTFVMSNLLQSFSILLFDIFLLINYYNQTNMISREVLEVLNVFNVLGTIHCIFFYGQYFSQLKDLTYCALLMVRDLIKVSFLIGFFFISFYFSLGYILNRYDTNQCDPHFDKPSTALYTIFKMMFNMHNSDVISGSHTGYAITHIIVVSVNSILLLNLLIAIYSDSTSYIHRNREVIEMVQMVSFAMANAHLWKYATDKFYKERKKKHFVEHDGKIYVHVRTFSGKISNQH